MALQLIAVAALALLLLAVRERALRADQRRMIARMREDREVAELEALFDLDWRWP